MPSKRWSPHYSLQVHFKSSVTRFILIALISILLPVPAVSAPKVTPGNFCKVHKQKVKNQNKVFTCIKSRKQLVWSKGVVVKPTPTPIIKATPAPAPIPAPTPTVMQAPKVLSPLEKLNSDIYQRYVVAQKSISPSFNFQRCPNANTEMAEITEKAFIDAYSFWVPVYTAAAKVNWLLMSEKDWNCWYETTVKFEGPNSVSRSWNVWNKDTGILGHCTVSSTAFCGYGTGVREDGLFAQYNLLGTNYTVAPTPLTVHHETVHIYQSQLIADNYKTSKTNTAACWFIEGQANLFGVPIAFKGDSTAHRTFEKNRLLNVYPQGGSYTKDQWLGVLNDLQNNKTSFCFDNELGYSLGWFALEWTYMNYSIEEMHTFLEAMAKGSTWEQAIQSVLSMDEQNYYSKIAQYLADELQAGS